MRLLFALFGLLLVPAVLCSLDDLCLERDSTGDHIRIDDNFIYFTDPSNPYACHVFEYTTWKDEREVNGYYESYIKHIRLVDSKCFVPGGSECREPTSYVIKIVYRPNLLDDDDDYAVYIGTEEDTCCARTRTLIGVWTPSDTCPTECDCSDDCRLLDDDCYTRTLKKTDLALSVVDSDTSAWDNTLVVTCDGDCFQYPFNVSASNLVVGADFCDDEYDDALNPGLRKRICDDPYGIYFCSFRLDTLTLYYYDDFCKSRTTVLGATWREAADDVCPDDCDCPAF